MICRLYGTCVGFEAAPAFGQVCSTVAAARLWRSIVASVCWPPSESTCKISHQLSTTSASLRTRIYRHFSSRCDDETHNSPTSRTEVDPSRTLSQRLGAKHLSVQESKSSSSVAVARDRNASREPPVSEQRVLTVGLLGYPNAGKSSLTNHLIENHITAVSSKRNTTVKAHLGAYTRGNQQLLFVDLPGVVHKFEFKEQASRVLDAWSEISSVDLVLMVVDAEAQHKHGSEHILRLARQLSARPSSLPAHLPWEPKRAILALNKADKIGEHLRTSVVKLLRTQFLKQHPFQQCYAVSALTGLGVPAMRSYLLSLTAPGQWMLPYGHVTDKDAAELACELVREQLYRRLNLSLPYTLEPRAEACWEDSAGSLCINVIVPVRNANVRMIVVGSGGSVINDYVSARAQQALQMVLKRDVKLKVGVKIGK